MPELNTLMKLGLDGLSYTSEQIKEYVGPLAGIKEELRRTLLDAGKIIPLTTRPLDLNTHHLTAVDGASVVKMQSYFDVLSVTAAVAEGNKHAHLYTDKNYPGITYSTIRQHSSEIDASGVSLIRSTAELMMLNRAQGYANIIDGSWISNLTSLLIDITRKRNTSYTNSMMLFEFLLYQKEKGWDARTDLFAVVDRLINPSAYDDSINYVALSKSDSSAILAKEYLGTQGLAFNTRLQVPLSPKLTFFLENFSVKDRVLADLALKPGEMLAPEPVGFSALASSFNIANAEESNGFEALKASHWDENSEEYQYLHEVLFGLLDTMPGASTANKVKVAQLKKNSDEPEESRIWTSYIKPSINGRALKMEFSRGQNTDVLEKAENLAYVIDQDMVNGIKEPYAQYLVDKRVKQVSVLSDLYLNNLRKELKQEGYDSSIIEMLSGGYRT